MWEYEIIGSTPDFSRITPNEVLFDFEGPQIFTFAWQDLLFLAYASDYDAINSKTRLLVVGTTSEEIEHLKQGRLAILEALSKPLVWAADWDGLVKATNINVLPNGINSVPISHRPEEGTLLWAHLESEDNQELDAYFREVRETPRFEIFEHSQNGVKMRWMGLPKAVFVTTVKLDWDDAYLHRPPANDDYTSIFLAEKFEAEMYDNILGLKH